MKLGAAVLTLALVLAASAPDARASLTSSEKGQIRDFVNRAQAENAARVRALVARTDLSVEETTAVLTEAVAPVPFTEGRAAFLRELVFGATSASSRSLLAPAVVQALLARADGIFQRFVGRLDHEAPAIAELLAIYGFIDSALANAGRATLAVHDASAGVSAAACEEASKSLRDHVERNARWLKGDGTVGESMGRLRAQAQLALFDMLPDGLTRRVDAADRLGLKGARRQMLVDWGILFQDAGKLDDARVERVRQLLVRLPAARGKREVLYAGDDRGPLRARGEVAQVASGSATDADPFGPEVTPVTVDPFLTAITHDLVLTTVSQAFGSRSDARLQAERDVLATHNVASRVLGRPRAPSVDHVIAAAATLVAIDAPRALDLAFSRFVAGHTESAALLSDALGALAGAEKSLEVGKNGGTASTPLTALRFGPTGAALGFAVDGHVWSIARPAPSFAVTAVTRDGNPVTLAQLDTARKKP